MLTSADPTQGPLQILHHAETYRAERRLQHSPGFNGVPLLLPISVDSCRCRSLSTARLQLLGFVTKSTPKTVHRNALTSQIQLLKTRSSPQTRDQGGSRLPTVSEPTNSSGMYKDQK
uniref:Uncharacterized protein n=1 Tax=Eutreptiella gymnastica TaxID=73025 RepID=A0A7S4FZ71_9EUGL